MNRAKEILGFAPPNSNFLLSAKHYLTDSQKTKIKNCRNQLLNIAIAIDSAIEDMPEADEIDMAYQRFVRISRGNNYFLSGRELKYITYAIDRINTPSLMTLLVKLLDERWKSRYISAIAIYLLNSWNSAKPDVLEIMRKFFCEKLSQYNGKRDKILMLKNNVSFFGINGPELLGLYLRKTNGSLFTVCQDIFGMGTNHIEYDFFTRTIVAYFEKSATGSLPLIEEVLVQHNHPITAKLLIPRLIICHESKQASIEVDVLKRLALKYIGDPTIKAKWSIANGTTEDNRQLENARVIVCEWLKKEFISLFFEKCVNEPGRKQYWLSRTNIILDFKIYTTRFVYDMILLKDSNLAEHLETNVECLRLEAYDKRAALVIDVGNYYIVEFSDIGSIYIYKKGSMYARPIEQYNITYLSELKKTSLTIINATNLISYKDECRILHQSGWEKKMDGWFEYYGIL